MNPFGYDSVESLQDEPGGPFAHQQWYEPKKKREFGPKPGKTASAVYDFVELFLVLTVVIVVLTTFFVRYSVVDGPSMERTLFDNEKLLVSDFLYTPKQGDIVIFQLNDLYDTPLVKRIIATEGQTVEIKTDGVYVNGVCYDDSFVYLDMESTVYRYTPMAPIVVPEGHVFVMGDHRNHSTDSRAFGCVDERNILGRVVLRLFPFSSFGKVE